jgi:hypothetical protein
MHLHAEMIPICDRLHCKKIGGNYYTYMSVPQSHRLIYLNVDFHILKIRHPGITNCGTNIKVGIACRFFTVYI